MDKMVFNFGIITKKKNRIASRKSFLIVLICLNPEVVVGGEATSTDTQKQGGSRGHDR